MIATAFGYNHGTAIDAAVARARPAVRYAPLVGADIVLRPLRRSALTLAVLTTVACGAARGKAALTPQSGSALRSALLHREDNLEQGTRVLLDTLVLQRALGDDPARLAAYLKHLEPRVIPADTGSINRCRRGLARCLVVNVTSVEELGPTRVRMRIDWVGISASRCSGSYGATLVLDRDKLRWTITSVEEEDFGSCGVPPASSWNVMVPCSRAAAPRRRVAWS